MYCMAISYHLSWLLLLLASSSFQKSFSFSLYFRPNYGQKCHKGKANHHSTLLSPLFFHKLPFLPVKFHLAEHTQTSTILQTHTLQTAISNYSSSEIGSDFRTEKFTPLTRSSSFSTSTMDQIRDFLTYSNIQDFKFVPIIERSLTDADDNIIHVKSLVWELSYLPTDQTNLLKTIQNNVFYIMVALPVDLFIDEEKLLKETVQFLLQSSSDENWFHTGEAISENWKIKLADRKLTEELTGCKIGSISPICAKFSDTNISNGGEDLDRNKNTDLDECTQMAMLLIDNSLFESTSAPDQSHFDNNQTVISVGSGCVEHDLNIQIHDMIKICKDQYEKGIFFANITTTKMNSPSTLSNVVINTISSDKAQAVQIKTTTTTVTTTTVTKTTWKRDTKNISDNLPSTISNGVTSTISSDTARTVQTKTTTAIATTTNGTKTTLKRDTKNISDNVIKDPRDKPKKLLSKRLRDYAGKLGKAEEVKSLIEEAGDDFPSVVEIGTTGNFTKNALHLAAWKGDLESMMYLTNAGFQYNLDLVNNISIGEGNYGKTPIFYAITQDRDDAVSLLMDLNANLLVVNNKGQTPCSMAVSHLQPETCSRMYELEAEQLSNGGKFANYRESNSDGKRYGDLDPRFLIDEENWSIDIEKEMKNMYQIVYGNDHPLVTNINENPNTRKALDALDINVYQKIYSEPLPRSLGQTTPEMRRAKFLSMSKISNATRKKLERAAKKEKKKKEKKSMELPKELMIDIDKLDKLTLHDLMGERNKCDSSPYFTLVDDRKSLSILTQAVNDAIDEAEGKAASKSPNGWGLDCEWKPSFVSGEENPVATLQLSTFDHAFLVDVQELCQSNIKSSDTPLTEMETVLSNTLAKIFSNPNIPIFGFGISQDLTKLFASFPHMHCFQLFESVVDLHPVSRRVYNQTPKHYMSSLQKMVGSLLNKRLDKTEQCSLWDNRPLERSQIEYAVLDAAVLPRLFLKMMTHPETGENLQEDLFNKSPNLKSTIRMTSLDNSVDENGIQKTYMVKMGSTKEMLSVRLSRQTWITGKKVPDLPEVIPLEVLNERRHLNQLKKEKKAARKLKQTSMRRKSIKLVTLLGDYEGMPSPGTFLGYTKDSCIHRVLGAQFMNSLPENIRLGYNRRGGVFEIKNGWILFINLGGGVQLGKYRNDFSKDGKQITFTVNPSNPSESALIDHFSKLKTIEDDSIEKKNVYLFMRSGTKGKFLYCGTCSCPDKSLHENGGTILNLELLDYNALMKVEEDKEDSSYREIFLSHSESLRLHDKLENL